MTSAAVRGIWIRTVLDIAERGAKATARLAFTIREESVFWFAETVESRVSKFGHGCSTGRTRWPLSTRRVVASINTVRGLKMSPLQQRIAALADLTSDLITELYELDGLHERIRKAELSARRLKGLARAPRSQTSLGQRRPVASRRRRRDTAKRYKA